MDDIQKLYQLYSIDIYKYLLSLTLDKHKAEDILQNTFVTAITAINTFKGNSTVKTWLIGIARNEYYTWHRKNPATMPIEEAQTAMDASLNGLVNDGEINHDYTEAMTQIAKLPELQKQIVILRLINEFSFLEIAKCVGQSENYCRVTFFRARQKLLEVLKND